jgi:hypothetical protein
MKAADLTRAIEAGKSWQTILQEQASEAGGLAEKYHDEADLYPRRSSRYRAAKLNAERWEAHAAGLREALTIVRIVQGQETLKGDRSP